MSTRARLVATAIVAGSLLATDCGQPSAPAAVASHVFIIVMENKSPAEALTGPFTASLAARYGVAENYRAITHPSVPNYLALTSGSTWGITDDSYHRLAKKDIGTQLTAAGISWRAYMQGFQPGGCLTSPLPYDPGHNPFAFYGGGCPPNVVPMTRLTADLAGATPTFAWLGPDQCNDEHSCSVAVGDAWLSQAVGQVIGSPAWTNHGVLFVTWDEDDGNGDNRVLTLVIAPGLDHRVSQAAYDHYSLLASIEHLLGVGRLGQAASASPMLDLLPA
ncbi:MAG TPA: alkaline phosphatase family protein [Candidatus Dormibacteraeota bacterium]|nr:alkaline phosphatase family protein [Candidatus Dormibacteraeota bacterium]